jgi:RimJ/RimL family protein N-acetyltransferase
MTAERYQIEWATPSGTLLASEPTPAELAAHAAELARAYNDPANSLLLGHSMTLSAADVVTSYTLIGLNGGRSFLAFQDGVLIGDADLRHAHDGRAEFAFLICSPAAQGKGLGTRLATLVAAFGFQVLALERIYASLLPTNTASRRVFEKIGFSVDDSPVARSLAEAPGDVVMAIDRQAFARLPCLEEIRIRPR